MMNSKAAAIVWLAAGIISASAAPVEGERTRTIRLIQDDAQDYMVSKVFQLKHLKANDATPFVLGVVKRYNEQSTVGRINYKAANEQLLTVSCPAAMMPYVDDLIAKLDRPAKMITKNAGDPIKGTGITRVVYPAKFRAAQVMVDVMKGIGINDSNASKVEYDPATNLIYWKDDINKSNDLLKYLAWLDRPVPMVNLSLTVYELRESELRDLGIDYLGWKNGPGLDLFQVAFDAAGASSAGSTALQAASGAMGGFFFAPQFDASFIRALQQDGRANLSNTASLTVANSDSATYTIGFKPQQQAIFKTDNDQTQLGISGLGMSGGVKSPANSTGAKDPLLNPSGTAPAPLSLAIKAPRICFRGSSDVKTGLLPYALADYNKTVKVLTVFGYTIQVANVVERNNYGAELAETSYLTGECNLLGGDEKILAAWTRESDVEQVIGVPFLSDIPVLKYLFSTTTTNKEKSWVFITAKTELVHPESIPPMLGGQLRAFEELSAKNN